MKRFIGVACKQAVAKYFVFYFRLVQTECSNTIVDIYLLSARKRICWNSKRILIQQDVTKKASHIQIACSINIM